MSKLIDTLKDRDVQEVIVDAINKAINIPLLPESVEDDVFKALMNVLISVLDRFDA